MRPGRAVYVDVPLSGTSTDPPASAAGLRERSYVGQAVEVPVVPSLVVRADPSRYVSPERARELEEMGFWVRSVPGAGHSVWYGHLDEFMEVLDEWL
ncbi:alpha/beta fold hydrolase [Kribbella sp. C-35]|uniref:alpha/beta fold hydrolase n=1 Tax=Kribbella sp. C-35 TaxID=2789276 RepID=UPI00397BB198